MEEAAISASVASVIVAVVAIFLAAYFYTQSKNTELNAGRALTKIETQTEALQKLTARWMDRLTKYVTEPKPVDENLSLLVSALKEMPTNIASQFQAPGEDATVQVLRAQLATAYMSTYYYTAVLNVAVQAYLPPLDELQPDDMYKWLVDQTHTDFSSLDVILGASDQSLLKTDSRYALYESASSYWKPSVKDSTMAYGTRKQESQPGPK